MKNNFAKAIEYYIDKPVEFVKDIIKAEPDEYQAKVLNDLAYNEKQKRATKISVRSGHGVGKSTIESWAILWFLVTRPFPKILCTAPTAHQLHDILWAEASKWLRNSKMLGDILEWTYEKIYLKGHREEWFAIARTSNKPDALQGTHAEHILIIIDEASGVPDVVFEPVLGTLSTNDAKLLMCGNPTQLAGFFYESHNDKKDLYITHVINGENSSRVDREYIKLIAEMFGTDSDVYRVRVLGEFPKANPDSFISLDMINTDFIDIGDIYSIDLGVDVARFGDDESVIATVFNKLRLSKLNIFQHNDTMELTGQVVNIIKSLNKDYPNVRVNVKVDCDGLGVGLYDRLREVINEKSLNARAVECHFGAKGGKVRNSEPISYFNSTGIMWGLIRTKFKEKSLYIIEDSELINQLTNRKYFIESDGDIRLERKEDMKKRGVHSPDRADALALALYEPPTLEFGSRTIL